MENHTIQQGTLTINIREGWSKNSFDFDKNALNIYACFNDFSSFKKAEISLDEKIVKVTSIVSSGMGGGYDYHTLNLVEEDGVWNDRKYKDISVIKNLEKVGEKRLLKEDRYRLEVNFGRTKKAKESVEEISAILNQELRVLKRDEAVLFRNWDQTQEVFITQGKTKLTFDCSREKVTDIVSVLNKHGYDSQADLIQEKSIELLIGEQQNIEIDLSPTFKK